MHHCMWKLPGRGGRGRFFAVDGEVVNDGADEFEGDVGHGKG